MKNVKDMAAHEIRHEAERGNPIAQAELKRRRKNRENGGLTPYWERK